MTNRRRSRLQGGWPRLGAFDRRVVLRVVAIGLGAFLVGYLVTALAFYRGGTRQEVVAVPDLRELDRRAAERRLDDLGLTLEVGDSLPHPQVRAGDVLAQSPLPGREVAPGTPVRVILSSGRARIPVPDVSMLSEEAATRLLGASGFQVQVEVVPDRLPAGNVVAVEPAPGTPVVLPSVVRLRVSAGPPMDFGESLPAVGAGERAPEREPMVAVPAIIGLAEAAARAALERVGLRLAEPEYEPAPEGVPEMVVEQTPPPGDSARAGAQVRVRIVRDR